MKKSAQPKIRVSVRRQELSLKSGRKKLAAYPISTSRFGLGSKEGSFKTPTGRFRISEKIGAGMPVGTVF
jgi:murein L,D-transpeptidase YafK